MRIFSNMLTCIKRIIMLEKFDQILIMWLKKLPFIIAVLVTISVRGNVVISGSIKNAKTGKIMLQKNSPFLTDFVPLIIFSTDQITNSCTINLQIKKAQIMRFYFSGTSINQDIFVSPGDKINFEIDGSTIKFFGPNQAAYNYFAERNKIIDNRKRPSFKKYETVLDYKSALIDWLNKEKEFLNDYNIKNPLPKLAIEVFNEHIKYDYNFYLNAPIADANVDKNKIPSNYLDNSILYNKDYLLEGNTSYGAAVIRKYLYAENSDPFNQCNQVYKNAAKKLKGKTRDFFMSNMIGLFVEKGAEENKEELVRIISLEKKIIKDTTYLDYINKKEEKLLILNRSLPDIILDNTFLTSYNGDQLTLRKILEFNKGKSVYVDLWASWCVPCREDIKKSANAKTIMLEKGTAYIYLSIDKNIDSWKQATDEEKITLNQFLIKNGLASPLGKFLNIFYIPRYIYLDEKHLVKNIYAPRPTEINELKKLLNPPTETKFN